MTFVSVFGFSLSYIVRCPVTVVNQIPVKDLKKQKTKQDIGHWTGLLHLLPAIRSSVTSEKTLWLMCGAPQTFKTSLFSSDIQSHY